MEMSKTEKILKLFVKLYLPRIPPLTPADFCQRMCLAIWGAGGWKLNCSPQFFF